MLIYYRLVLSFVCCFVFLGTRQVNGGAFPETEAMKAGFESVHKVITKYGVHFTEEFNKDVETLKALKNDAPQAVGNFLIGGILDSKNGKKNVINIFGFTILLFELKFNEQWAPSANEIKTEIKDQFETNFVKNLLANGPVFGIGTSVEWKGGRYYYMMTFFRGSKILDKFMDILNGQILVSASATFRAMKFRGHRMAGKKREDEDSELYGYYTLITTPCDKSENPESALLAAIQALQPNSTKSLMNVLKNSTLKTEHILDEEEFEKATEVSYGFSSWQKGRTAYMGIFYTLVKIKNNAFPVPPTTFKDKIPQLGMPANSNDAREQESGDYTVPRKVGGEEEKAGEEEEEEGEAGEEEDEEENEQPTQEKREQDVAESEQSRNHDSEKGRIAPSTSVADGGLTESEVLYLLRDVLSVEMFINTKETIRAIQFRQEFISAVNEEAELNICKKYAKNFTLISTALNGTREISLLEALKYGVEKNEQTNTEDSLYAFFAKPNEKIVVAHYIPQRCTINDVVSYGIVLWEKNNFAYMAVFYIIGGDKNDRFGLPRKGQNVINAPQLNHSNSSPDIITTPGGPNNLASRRYSVPAKPPGPINNTVQQGKPNKEQEDEEDKDEKKDPRRGQQNQLESAPSNNSASGNVETPQEHKLKHDDGRRTESASPVNSGGAPRSSPNIQINYGSKENTADQQGASQTNQQTTTGADTQANNKTNDEEIQKNMVQEKHQKEAEKPKSKIAQVLAIQRVITNHRKTHISRLKRILPHKKEIPFGENALEVTRAEVDKVIRNNQNLPIGGLALLEENVSLKEHARRRMLLFRMQDTVDMGTFEKRAEYILKEKVQCEGYTEKFNIKRLNLEFCGIDVKDDPKRQGQVVVGVLLAPKA